MANKKNSYEYNSQNTLTKTTVQVGTQSYYHFYEYDRLGQLIKVYTSTDGAKPAQADVVYAYNPVGAVDTLRYGEQAGGGFAAELPYRYNLREWLTDIDEVSSGLTPFAAKYTYFANGNIQESEYRNTGSPMEQRYKYAYSYDNSNRLKSADYKYYSGSWQNPARFDVSGLQYDGNGNILALVRNKENDGAIDQLSYSYTPGANRLQTVTDAISNTPEDWDAEDTEFSYDGNGNVTSMLENGAPAISSIEYDHRNLPTSLVNRNGDVVSYRYNAAGQRIFKQIGSQAPEYYIMDGDQTVAVYENGAVKYWNILANGVVGRHDAAGGSKFYYLKDHLGSTRAVVNASGTEVEAHDYYPFGLQMPGRDYVSGVRTKELFTGKERDIETGLDYFGARYYWAAGGRWWSVDPVAEKFSSVSPFNYALNSPTKYFDPNGLWPNLSQLYTLDEALGVLSYFSDEQILSFASDIHGISSLYSNNPGNRRYVALTDYGGFSPTNTSGIASTMIDMQHFLYAASNTINFKSITNNEAGQSVFGSMGSLMTVIFGDINEMVQFARGSNSGNAPEDRPSNILGAEFGRVYDPKSKLSFTEQLRKFLLDNGALNSKKELDRRKKTVYKNLPQNNQQLKDAFARWKRTPAKKRAGLFFSYSAKYQTAD